MRRSALLALVTTVGAATAATTLATSSAATTPTITFGVPRVVDPIHVYGEPDIAENPKTGALHASGPQGTGTQRSIWNVSVDGGDSYRIVQNLPTGDYPSAAIPTKSLIAPGGGDTEVQIAHNGQAFFNDLAALACFSAVTTKDDGATTSPANPAGCSDPGADRQWIALYDPAPGQATVSLYTGPRPLAYMEYTGQVNGNDIVSSSTDGVDYSHHAGDFANESQHQPNHTPIIVDQRTGDLLGMTTDGNKGDSLALVVGKPDAKGDLTFHYNHIAKTTGDPQTLFPILTEDTARNLYAVWIQDDTYQVYYSWSPPNAAGTDWTHWSAPRQISKPPAAVNVFPWAAAGKDGILDIAWYGTPWTLQQLGKNGPSEKKNQPWQLFFSQLTNADSSSPTVSQVIAAPHPMHYNDICMLGTLCISGQGNRNQADFFKLVIGKDGRARIIYTDSSNRLSQVFNTDTSVDHQGAALDTVVTQNTGFNAWTGAPLKAKESTAPISGITDPTGDALFKPLGGTNVPGGDITALKLAVQGSDLVITTTLGGRLSDAAKAGAVPFAELVVRWQLGDVLYDAGVEEDAVSGTPRFFAGRTGTVDLCSVSGCKPNYMVYPAPPAPGGGSADGSVTGNTYTIKVPLSQIGSPTSKKLLEEVMGFVTVSPMSYAVPLDNVRAFADEVPLQIEGTRTFNFRPAATTRTTPGATGGSGTTGGTGGTSGTGGTGTTGGSLATTGLRTAIPAFGLALLLAGLLIARRHRRAQDHGRVPGL